MPASDDKAYGCLETLQEQGGRLCGTGWLLRVDGPLEDLALVLPDGRKLPVQVTRHEALGQVRSHVQNAANGGFRFEVEPTFDETGTFRMVVAGNRAGRPGGAMTIDYHRPTERPLPPVDVRKRAIGNEHPGYYVATGVKDANDIRRWLAPHVDLDAVRDLLEWGCGAGRITRHLMDRFPNATVYGHDIDTEAVEWAARHLEGGRFSPCGREPPLPHEADAFDVVVAISVFTHLTRAYQEAWLEELQRVIRPGGVLLATTHGTFAGRWNFPDDRVFNAMFKTGFSDSTKDHGLGDVAQADYYRGTFQTYEYTQQAWTKWFDIVAFVEGGLCNMQDVYVLRVKKGG